MRCCACGHIVGPENRPLLIKGLAIGCQTCSGGSHGTIPLALGAEEARRQSRPDDVT